MQHDLKGQVALITGSGRGIGWAVADRLAALGAAVAVHDISADAPGEFGEAANLDAAVAKIAERHGDVRAIAVSGDVADEAAVLTLVRRAEDALGPITLLVNCAGGDIAAQGGKPVPNDALGVPLDDVRAILDRNLIGTMLACRAVCPGMAKRGGGAVVNVGSVAAHSGVAEGVAYACAKAAVVHFTRCLARELRPRGVRVNCVSPGPTKTARFLATRPTDPKLMDDEQVSLHRYATPEEIADAVAFLCSDGARFISGQVLCVEGGAAVFPT